MNKEKHDQIKKILSDVHHASHSLTRAMINEPWTQNQDQEVLISVAIEELTNVLDDLHSYKRKHYPSGKIVGLDFPTMSGIRFDRVTSA